MVQTPARDLHGRRALVSGGTKGAGAAIARRLEAAGATVLVTARSQPQDLKPELFIAADLTSDKGVDTAVAEALDRLGGIDVLVNNLGGSAAPAGGFAALSEDDWLRELRHRRRHDPYGLTALCVCSSLESPQRSDAPRYKPLLALRGF
jgi:NADP-dependent 3-hydroxy acid dehydrogenase YdfG